MKKLAVALLATATLSMPAMAASNMTQQSQGTQAQPSQDQQPQAQDTKNNNQAAQNRASNEQTIKPDSLSRNEIRQVQQALDKNGFQVGRVDGRWGPKTSDALQQFQQSKNIQANGQLDQQTLSDLGLNSAQFAQENQNNSSQAQ